jgi:hypothetical protein
MQVLSKPQEGNSMASQILSDQGRIVYKAMLDQLDTLKKQQWTITNYLVAIYVAIFWVGNNMKQLTDSEKWSLTALTVVAGIYGVVLLVVIQYDMGQARRRIQDADVTIFDPQERAALGIERYRGPHRRGISFLAALIGVCVVGAILLVRFLWR